MNIFQRNWNNRQDKILENIVIDTDKHIPLFLLINRLQLQNSEWLPNVTKYLEKDILKYYKNVDFNDVYYDFNTTLVFNRIPAWMCKKADLNKFIFNLDFSYESRYGNYGGLGSYMTLMNNSASGKSYLYINFTLCVKKGYERYIQLCLLTGSEIEYDCLYLLYDKNLIDANRYSLGKQAFNHMAKYCKSYTVEMIPVDNVLTELSYDFTLFKGIKSIPEMNNKIKEFNKILLTDFRLPEARIQDTTPF